MIDLFQKCQEIYEGIRRHVWYMIPIVGIFLFIKWFILEWLPARALQALDTILKLLPDVNVNLQAVGVNWDRINQWFPVNETIVFAAAYVAIASLLIAMRWVRKLLPFA